MDSVEAIAKQTLHIVLLVDASRSMAGKRIKQVDQAISDIKDYLLDLQSENANVDFAFTIIPFGNEAEYYEGKREIPMENFTYQGIKTGGYSNLDKAYELLTDILKKQSKGGIMSDFGGIAPILLLLTDGHPTGNKHKDALAMLKSIPWFKVALRYGVAIELDDKRTKEVLQDFVGNNGEVVTCYDASMLKNIIKIIVCTASKSKSSSASVRPSGGVNFSSPTTPNAMVVQEIAEALQDQDQWEW